MGKWLFFGSGCLQSKKTVNGYKMLLNVTGFKV